MIVVMEQDANEEQVERMVQKVEEAGLEAILLRGEKRNVIAAIGDKREVNTDSWLASPGVERIVPILSRYKRASREVHPETSQIPLNGEHVGGTKVQVIAGPCAVESLDETLQIARCVKDAGAVALRGGAYKPRTSPYSFQGLEQRGLEILAEARARTGLSVVTEVMTAEQVPMVAEYADVLQVGARNMQNFVLLKALGEADKPVLLKRGMSATAEELLLAAEYIMQAGNPNVILCCRGIRTFEDHTRHTLSLGTVPYLKEVSHLPVVVDPSHGTGKRSLVAPMCRAAVACGADGLIIEVHPHPEEAAVDGPQTITCDAFARLMQGLEPVARAVGRSL